jgi:PelA/Pel-15E family pectate lyase
MSFATSLLSLAVLLLMPPGVTAAVIGTNSAALPMTTERIVALPQSEQAGWKKYLAQSEKQARADRAFFRNEMRRHGVTETASPPAGRGTRGMALDRADEWYGSDEALRIADIIVSFQTPAGGWSKNLDMTLHRRAPGEQFAQGNASKFANSDDLDMPHDPSWNYVGTFDNGATTTQLRFLARVITARGERKSDELRKSLLRGLDYIFAAQYPNGGWPQVWPLQGGYHDAITFNDGAMTAILDLLAHVSAGREEFAFTSASTRKRAAASSARGLQCVLTTQVTNGGGRSAWCQQYDALTLQPTSARNYEMPSLSSGESAGIMLFLMRLPTPDSNVIASVRAAAEWFKRTEIRDKDYRRSGDDGRHLIAAPGSGPLWSRYYELGSNRPIFGDRDKSIHDTVEEISRERRDGYAWFTDAPQAALKRFERWNGANR